LNWRIDVDSDIQLYWSVKRSLQRGLPEINYLHTMRTTSTISSRSAGVRPFTSARCTSRAPVRLSPSHGRRSTSNVAVHGLGEVAAELAALAVGGGLGAGAVFLMGGNKSASASTGPSTTAAPAQQDTSLPSQVAKLQSELAGKAAALAKAEAAAASAAKLQQEVSDKQSELAQLRQAKGQLDRQVTAQQEQVKTATEEAAAAKEQLSSLQSRLEAVSAQYATASNETSALRAAVAAQVNQLNSALAAAQADAKQAVADKEKAEAGAVRARTEMAGAGAQVAKLQRDVTALSQRLGIAEARVQEAEAAAAGRYMPFHL
jgi:chromosome segregation ATPase